MAAAAHDEKINILLVDDQPAKLLAYEVMLQDSGENLLKANSAREALETLLKTDVAIVLMDVSMPELDGFELAAMVRNHPRFQRTAIIFVSAVHLSDVDFLRGYQMGAVDYVSVPVIPEVLRAKVKVFAELYRKTRELERLNAGLEARVTERTSELEATAARLRQSEQRRNHALAAGQMGSWDWDIASGDVHWDDGQYAIIGVEKQNFAITLANLRKVVHPADWQLVEGLIRGLNAAAPACQAEFRIRRPDGELRWCFGTAAATIGDDGALVRMSGVTIDITERRRYEEQQELLVREVDHRAKNVLAVVQSIIRLSRAGTVEEYVSTIEGRIKALSHVHGLLAQSRWEGTDLTRLIEDELAPYLTTGGATVKWTGPSQSLDPSTAQALALALHELSTNAAKYGALSRPNGKVEVSWTEDESLLYLTWIERGGPAARRPQAPGFGMKVIERSVDAQLGGAVAFDWRKEGLICRLTVPLTRPTAAASREQAAEMGMDAGKKGRGTVLLVEDEALVAIMMCDVLDALGFNVVGPLASVAQAIGPARDAMVDAALLDVTLGNERIYPVADVLKERRIPFAFLTGYGREGIDGRFADVPVIQKPVDDKALTAFLDRTITPAAGAGGAAATNGSAGTGARAGFQFEPSSVIRERGEDSGASPPVAAGTGDTPAPSVRHAPRDP
jgi:two-component sensor histidine kinase/response regulator RpfG family c-di-GMP phosphodiesterase